MPAKKLKTATLKGVFGKALRDEKFFAALVRNPEKALREAGMRLASAPMKHLHSMIRRRRADVTVDPVGVIRYVHRGQGRVLDPNDWPKIPLWIKFLRSMHLPKPLRGRRASAK